MAQDNLELELLEGRVDGRAKSPELSPLQRGIFEGATEAQMERIGEVGNRSSTLSILKNRLMERLGAVTDAVEKFNIGDTDMTAQALRAKEAGADVVLTYAIGPELAQTVNAIVKLGWQVPVMGSWTLSMSSFIDAAGKNAEGVFMPQTFIQAPSTPKRKEFIEKYQAAYKVDRIPSPVSAAQGYDSMLILAAAIEQAKSTDGRKIREALENLNAKVEGVVTTYDKPFTDVDHETITANIPVLGTVKDGRVVAADPKDLEGDKALRLKAKN